tara:strand:+ start:142 stop:507 length:366 start_codon:yes stop_codon:yes gene_type:complete
MYKKFNDFEYPIPGVDTAIKTLRPGARWDLFNQDFIKWEDDEGREPPTWEEIQEEMRREVDIYNYYLYERNREEAYPDWRDQLDMLYHDIKSGNLSDGSWIAAIDAVKEQHPKPEGPEPTL